MISILNELTLEIGDAITCEEEVTLWLVNYGKRALPQPGCEQAREPFSIALGRVVSLTQGWLNWRRGDDPYQEQSLRIFGGDGFSLPETRSQGGEPCFVT